MGSMTPGDLDENVRESLVWRSFSKICPQNCLWQKFARWHDGRIPESEGALCSFCLPCHSFLGHWDEWTLGWAWDVLNEGSPHCQPPCACGCMCMHVQWSKAPSSQTQKAHTHAHTHRLLWHTFHSSAFMSEARLTRAHTHHLSGFSAVKGALSL